MNESQIKKVVQQTIDELTSRGLIVKEPPTYPQMLQHTEKRLHAYFHKAKLDSALHDAIVNLLGDPYIELIFHHYRDKRTIEWIAEKMDKDVSTIKRNKKRLITKIYESLEG